MEIEAKYTIADETVFERLLQAERFGPFSGGPLSILEVEDVYLDTTDRRILLGGYACRLRRQGAAGPWSALLKGLGGAQRGLHQRVEIEVELPNYEPDPARWPASDAREQAVALGGEGPLQLLVGLQQTRHVRRLYAGERLIAELSLDRVAIGSCANRAERIDLEVEAEAKGEGTLDDIRVLADLFESEWALTPQPLSKFQRALALLDIDTATPPVDRLRPGDRPVLERVAATARPSHARRARLFLSWADGASVHQIQETLGYSRSSVYFWIDAYARKGLGAFPARVLAQVQAVGRSNEIPTERPVSSSTPHQTRPRDAVRQGNREMPNATPGSRSMDANTEAPAGIPPGSTPGAEDDTRSGATIASAPALGAPEAVTESVPVSLADLLHRHQVDLSHARHVAALAVRLFDLTTSQHHLPARSRPLLEKAGLLHNLGLTADPERHHAAGRDLLLATPVKELTEVERQMAAAIIFLHRKRISRPKLDKKIVTGVPSERHNETLELAALIRIADGLDASLSQTTRIVNARASAVTLDVILSGPLAAEDAARAQTKADLWDLLHPVPFRFFSATGNPLAPSATKAASDADDAAPNENAVISYADAAPAPVEPAGSQSPGVPQIALARPEPAPDSSAIPEALADIATARTPGIRPDEATAEAGRKVLAFHLARLFQHEPGTRQGKDIEEVHDMRVAARRLRSAFRVFGDYFQPAAVAAYNKGLRRTGEALGAVRDLDVLSANAHRYEAGLSGQGGALDLLLQAWEAQREVARRRLIQYLDSDGYRRFVRAFTDFVLTPGTGARRLDPACPEPYVVRHVAPRLIYTAFERVRAYETLLDQPSLELLHALRIECKRLRYTLEFLREVLGPEAAPVIAEVTALQDHLGELHDADVAETLLRSFLNGMLAPGTKNTPRPRVLAPGVAQYLAARQSDLQALLLSFPAAWAHFNRPEIRQSLALAVSVL